MNSLNTTFFKSITDHPGGRLPHSGLGLGSRTDHRGDCMALAADTPVPTPEGWKPMSLMTQGEHVFDQAGRPCTVTAACHRQPERVFQVTFDDGAFLIAGATQPWVTMSHSLRHRIHTGTFALKDWSWDFAPANTEQISKTLMHKRKSLEEAMHSVPLAEALSPPERELPVDPYLL